MYWWITVFLQFYVWHLNVDIISATVSKHSSHQLYQNMLLIKCKNTCFRLFRGICALWKTRPGCDRCQDLWNRKLGFLCEHTFGFLHCAASLQPSEWIDRHDWRRFTLLNIQTDRQNDINLQMFPCYKTCVPLHKQKTVVTKASTRGLPFWVLWGSL